MSKSLNQVQLIGNLVKDPTVNQTTNGTQVATFVVATDRGWTTSTGEKKEQSEFHRVVAWDKLAEIVGKILTKGRKVYISGRLTNRKYTDKEGVEKFSTEIVANDMIALDSKKQTDPTVESEVETPTEPQTAEVTTDDIPF